MSKAKSIKSMNIKITPVNKSRKQKINNTIANKLPRD